MENFVINNQVVEVGDIVKLESIAGEIPGIFLIHETAVSADNKKVLLGTPIIAFDISMLKDAHIIASQKKDLLTTLNSGLA